MLVLRHLSPAFSAQPALLEGLQRLASTWLADPTPLRACFSSMDGKIGADEGEVAEMIESTIVRTPREKGQPPRVLTTRREALALYRDVLRYSNLFVWRDARGRVWRDVIRGSARAEFDAARLESDPELVSRMLVTGRDAVQKAVEQFMKRRQQIIDEEAAAQGPPGGGVR